MTRADIRGALAGFAIVTLLLALCGIAAAAPARAQEPCVPNPGQEYIAPTYAVEYEYIEHVPAVAPVGDEYISNPQYVGPTTVEHPAETKIVTHPAEYATEYLYTKQVRGIWQQQTGKGNNFQWVNTGTFDWENWSGNLTRWGSADFTESGPHSAVQSTEGKKRKVTTEYRYVQTGQTRQGAQTKAAWDETVTIRDAWTETVPGNGLPETIKNPDYQPGSEAYDKDPTWHPEGWKAPSDLFTPTGNERSGEGITEMTDPGQPAIDPIECEEEPTSPNNPTTPSPEPSTPPVVPSAPTPISSPQDSPSESVASSVSQPQSVNEPSSGSSITTELAATGVSPWVGLWVALSLIALGGVGLYTRQWRKN